MGTWYYSLEFEKKGMVTYQTTDQLFESQGPNHSMVLGSVEAHRVRPREPGTIVWGLRVGKRVSYQQKVSW
jgi:hypothetical protein